MEREVAPHLVEGEEPLLAGHLLDRLGRAVGVAQRVAEVRDAELRGMLAQQGEQLLLARLAQALMELRQIGHAARVAGSETRSQRIWYLASSL